MNEIMYGAAPGGKSRKGDKMKAIMLREANRQIEGVHVVREDGTIYRKALPPMDPAIFEDLLEPHQRAIAKAFMVPLHWPLL